MVGAVCEKCSALAEVCALWVLCCYGKTLHQVVPFGMVLTPGSQEDPRGTATDEVVQWVIRGFASLSAEACCHAKDGSKGG